MIRADGANSADLFIRRLIRCDDCGVAPTVIRRIPGKVCERTGRPVSGDRWVVRCPSGCAIAVGESAQHAQDVWNRQQAWFDERRFEQQQRRIECLAWRRDPCEICGMQPDGPRFSPGAPREQIWSMGCECQRFYGPNASHVHGCWSQWNDIRKTARERAEEVIANRRRNLELQIERQERERRRQERIRYREFVRRTDLHAAATGDATRLAERLADPGAIDTVIEDVGRLRRALGVLDGREERILWLRFWCKCTLSEIGAALNPPISVDRVRQIAEKAIRRLSRSADLRPLLAEWRAEYQ